MKQEFSKEHLRDAQQHLTQSQQEQTQQTREFHTPDEMLRYDAAQVQPPSSLLERLKESLNKEIAPKGWWRRWFTK